MKLRPELPTPIPAPIARLPRHRGYPVPWFVAWLNADGQVMPHGQGIPDFRVLHPGAIGTAVGMSLCWVCGQPHNKHVAYAFVIGPMCAVNRVSAEPPSHIACADWSARACPFLARPHMVRREGDIPEGSHNPAGIMLDRNPGVSLVWLTRQATAFPTQVGHEGLLFNVGVPVQVRFYREGRIATRDEIMESIASGLPALRELAEAQGDFAVAALEEQYEEALELLPAA